MTGAEQRVMVLHPSDVYRPPSLTAPSCSACSPAASRRTNAAITFQEERGKILLWLCWIDRYWEKEQTAEVLRYRKKQGVEIWIAAFAI
jgi:hypothetical protein